MAERACVQRLQKEFRALCKLVSVNEVIIADDTAFYIRTGTAVAVALTAIVTAQKYSSFAEPVPHVLARPSPTDILEWHYVLEGSENTPFEGGVYHGKVKFPPEYPYKPPGISMITPNGRFATQKRICMSMSDFHPETWNPMWSVSSILTGLLSFMMDNTPTTGSVSTSNEEKQRLAQNSLAFNCKSAVFRKMFPEYVEKHLEKQRAVEQAVAEQAKQNGVNGTPVSMSDTQIPATNGRAEGKGVHQKPSQKFPFWLTALIVAIFASIMALPLLTLDLTTS